ncbi:MAG: aldehyde dehydrogenase family protein, partial [Acidimicrobiales bacterium]
WAAMPGGARGKVLHAVADVLGQRRGRLIGLMAHDGGKTFAESDPEVSEAVDFARYYGDRATELDAAGDRYRPLGTVAVVPPWNFPLAIPAGGVLASLAAGNTVVFKPAPETVAVAYAIAVACWDAGVPRSALHFVPTADDDAGRRLVTHPDVGAVVLTGAWDTARLFLGWRPDLRLHAETSGKNAIVVTAAADLDRAVADLVHSAFGHAGQKCSAASLAIVEASVHDDERFRRQLGDAAASLRPGPAYDPASTLGPLIRPAEEPLTSALTRLEPGETWLLQPRRDAANPQLWSPGIKLGVAPGSPFHLTECFGPVLGLMRAADLDQAIAWQNQPAYGLTAGLHSLDPSEISHWLERVEAGNLYVNRHITGAIVRRQPFGGWKRSVVGPGAKAGGPHYVASLGSWSGTWGGTPEAFGEAVRAELDGPLAPADPSGLAAEANVLRHLPLHCVLIRAGGGVTDREVALAAAAGHAAGAAVTVSSPRPRSGADVSMVEDDEAFLVRAGAGGWDKVRVLGDVAGDTLLAVYDRGAWVDRSAVVADPRVEVLRWVREQAVSISLHRHGNLTGRYDGVVAALRDRRPDAAPGRADGGPGRADTAPGKADAATGESPPGAGRPPAGAGHPPAGPKVPRAATAAPKAADRSR